MYIFSARALASCRCRPLSSNVRQHKNTLRYPSRKCACRRELNSHEAAEPQDDIVHTSLRAPKQAAAERKPMELCPATRAKECGVGTGTGNPQHKDMGPPRYIGRPVCVGSVGFQSVRRAATVSSASLGPNGYGGLNTRRPNRQQREAGNFGAAHQAKSQGLCGPAAHGPAHGAA